MQSKCIGPILELILIEKEQLSQKWNSKHGLSYTDCIAELFTKEKNSSTALQGIDKAIKGWCVGHGAALEVLQRLIIAIDRGGAKLKRDCSCPDTELNCCYNKDCFGKKGSDSPSLRQIVMRKRKEMFTLY